MNLLFFLLLCKYLEFRLVCPWLKRRFIYEGNSEIIETFSRTPLWKKTNHWSSPEYKPGCLLLTEKLKLMTSFVHSGYTHKPAYIHWPAQPQTDCNVILNFLLGPILWTHYKRTKNMNYSSFFIFSLKESVIKKPD